MPVDFLAAMLQRVQAERGDGRGVGHVPDAEYAALLVQLVVLAAEVKAMSTLSSIPPSAQRLTARPCGVGLQQRRPLPCRGLLAAALTRRAE